jgi:hypothetical protein
MGGWLCEWGCAASHAHQNTDGDRNAKFQTPLRLAARRTGRSTDRPGEGHASDWIHGGRPLQPPDARIGRKRRADSRHRDFVDRRTTWKRTSVFTESRRTEADGDDDGSPPPHITKPSRASSCQVVPISESTVMQSINQSATQPAGSRMPLLARQGLPLSLSPSRSQSMNSMEPSTPATFEPWSDGLLPFRIVGHLAAPPQAASR